MVWEFWNWAQFKIPVVIWTLYKSLVKNKIRYIVKIKKKKNDPRQVISELILSQTIFIPLNTVAYLISSIIWKIVHYSPYTFLSYLTFQNISQQIYVSDGVVRALSSEHSLHYNLPQRSLYFWRFYTLVVELFINRKDLAGSPFSNSIYNILVSNRIYSLNYQHSSIAPQVPWNLLL